MVQIQPEVYFAGGVSPGSVNIIEYIVIQHQQGQAIDFGDTIKDRTDMLLQRCVNSTRGVYCRWIVLQQHFITDIEYITLSTLGNGAEFGDLLNLQISTSEIFPIQ